MKTIATSVPPEQSVRIAKGNAALTGQGGGRGVPTPEPEAKLGEDKQTAIGKLQPPERRQQRTPCIEIAGKYPDQLVARIEQIKRRHENIAQQRGIDPVNQPGQGTQTETDLLFIVAHEPLARLRPVEQTFHDRCAERLELRDRLGKLVRLERAAFGIGRRKEVQYDGPLIERFGQRVLEDLAAQRGGRGEVRRPFADVERRPRGSWPSSRRSKTADR